MNLPRDLVRRRRSDEREHIFLGTSNMVFPEPNKALFPAEFRTRPRLAYYASFCNSLEVNSSFYRIHRAATWARWAAETPAAFRFSVKMFRGITHAENLAYDPLVLGDFLTSLAPAQARRGCLLIQFPAGLGPTAFGRLEKLVRQTRQAAPEWPLALEFRDPAWYGPNLSGLARDEGLSIVLHDMPRSRRDEPAEGSAPVYVRFHGPAGDYRGGYSTDTLAAWARRILRWTEAGRDVYAYFNNTLGDALANETTLRQMLSQNPPAADDLPCGKASP